MVNKEKIIEIISKKIEWKVDDCFWVISFWIMIAVIIFSTILSFVCKDYIFSVVYNIGLVVIIVILALGFSETKIICKVKEV